MKNLDLMSYDVMEMNQQDMLDNEGGSLIGIGIALLCIALCTSSCVNSNVQINIGSNNGGDQSVQADSTNAQNGNEGKASVK